MIDPLKGFLIGTAGYFGVPHRDAIPAIRAAGFGGVEILCKPGHFEPENAAHVDEVCEMLADWPEAVVTFHAPFHTADLGSADPIIWKEDVEHVAQSLRAASKFRAESATIHPRGRGQGVDWSDDSFTAFRQALEVLAPTAAECGIKLSVENMFPDRFAGAPRELLSLIEGYPTDRLGVCFDTGHANFAGGIIEIGSALASRTFVMHIHDNHAVGNDEHGVPGDGNIPWPELVATLQSNGYAGRNVIEYVERDVDGNTIDRFRYKLNTIGEAIISTGLSRLNGRCDNE